MPAPERRVTGMKMRLDGLELGVAPQCFAALRRERQERVPMVVECISKVVGHKMCV
jgi:hypothetical protein